MPIVRQDWFEHPDEQADHAARMLVGFSTRPRMTCKKRALLAGVARGNVLECDSARYAFGRSGLGDPCIHRQRNDRRRCKGVTSGAGVVLPVPTRPDGLSDAVARPALKRHVAYFCDLFILNRH